jgi:hypothetical protein
MISEIAQRHNLVVARRAAEKRLTPWLRPYTGGPLTHIDASPVFSKEWGGRESAAHATYLILQRAHHGGIIHWPGDRFPNAIHLQGNDGNDGQNTGDTLVMLDNLAKTMSIYGFITWAGPTFFYAKYGWEVEAFSTSQAQVIIDRFESASE